MALGRRRSGKITIDRQASANTKQCHEQKQHCQGGSNATRPPRRAHQSRTPPALSQPRVLT